MNAEEEALWQKVVARTRPVDPARIRLPFQQPTPEVPTKPKAAPPPEPIAPFTLGQRAADPRAFAGLVSPRASGLNMDHKAFQRMKRGKLVVEGRIDLHGMTLAEAHPVLTGFILGSHGMGRRLVLVITGKGRTGRDDAGMGDGKGVLKRQVPQWLRMAPLASVVLQFNEAHATHGGSGAYYVYLKRRR